MENAGVTNGLKPFLNTWKPCGLRERLLLTIFLPLSPVGAFHDLRKGFSPLNETPFSREFWVRQQYQR
jgi:hypothetical protein